MKLTKKQADKLMEAIEGLEEMDTGYLSDLATDGDSEDREQDTEYVQEMLTDWLGTVATVVRVAREVGLQAEIKEPNLKGGAKQA